MDIILKNYQFLCNQYLDMAFVLNIKSNDMYHEIIIYLGFWSLNVMCMFVGFAKDLTQCELVSVLLNTILLINYYKVITKTNFWEYIELSFYVILQQIILSLCVVGASEIS